MLTERREASKTMEIDDYYRNGNTRSSMDRLLRKRAPLTPAVFHILLALADGPLHGYAIMQAVERSAGAEPPMGPGTIYGSLQRMEEAGLVRETAARGDDRRRLFALLPAGRRALLQEAERLAYLAALVRDKRLVPGEA
jgi:DNA-binding MarR family transcriptional regulator